MKGPEIPKREKDAAPTENGPMMTDLPLRAACIHGRYEPHHFVPLGSSTNVEMASCLGGPEITDGEIRELAYQLWLKDQTRLIDKALSDEALAFAAAIGDTG